MCAKEPQFDICMINVTGVLFAEMVSLMTSAGVSKVYSLSRRKWGRGFYTLLKGMGCARPLCE
jgi:hypothetical protein